MARALLAQTDDQLARSRLTAPFDGVVSDRVHRAVEEVARGESLRGNEKLDAVGVLEGETRRVTAERAKPPA